MMEYKYEHYLIRPFFYQRICRSGSGISKETKNANNMEKAEPSPDY